LFARGGFHAKILQAHGNAGDIAASIGTPEKADRILNPDLAEGRLADRAQARLTDDQ
jgi:hypothetical protein